MTKTSPRKRAYIREWRARNIEKVRAYGRRYSHRTLDRAKRRSKKLRVKYGLTVEQFAALVAAQGGLCAICRVHPGEKTLYIDHDHVTGKIRGLLCSHCNSGLGYFRDNPDALTTAAAYLRSRK